MEKFQPRYKKASKQEKPKIAREVVQSWRNQEPPGRFLVRTDKGRSDSNWHDVGDLLALKRATKTLGEKPQRERRAMRAAKSLQGRAQVSVPNVAANGAHAATGDGISAEPFRFDSPFATENLTGEDTFLALSGDQDCSSGAVWNPQESYETPPLAGHNKLDPPLSKTSTNSASGIFYESYINRKRKQCIDDVMNIDFSWTQHPTEDAPKSPAYMQTNLIQDISRDGEHSRLPTAADLVNGLFEDDDIGDSF